MPRRGRDAEGPQRSDAADAKDELLVEPHLAAPDVQDVGDRPVRRRIQGRVRIQQDDGHPADADDPDVDVNVAAWELDRHGQLAALSIEHAADRQPMEVVIRVAVLLVAVGVDRLAEIAVAIEEADSDQRQRHVAGGLHVIAREDAEAAGVDAERFVEAVFGAEVGDRAGESLGVAAMEPVVGAIREVPIEVADDAVGFAHEVGVVEEASPVDHAGDDRNGAVASGPRAAVDPGVEPAGTGMPGPVEVVGEAPEAFELGGHPEVRRRRRRDAYGGLHRSR